MKDKKIQDLREKGITLIALVVTIIILLILAGVTLNMAINGDGLFSRARNAADKYKKAQEEEQDLISEIGKEMNSEYVGAYVTGYNPVKKTKDNPCIIGTDTSGYTSEQTFETEEIGWRIWDYDGTTLRIISDKPTTQKLELKGVAGYNNGVYAINEICRKCYYNDELGVTVRNLRRSDIEKVSNYDYTKYKHKPSGGQEYLEVFGDENEENLIYYGESKKYEKGFQSPAMWEEHDKNWTYQYNKKNKTSTGDISTEIPWEQEYGSETEIEKGSTTAITEFTQSYYYHNYLNKQGEFKDTKYYDLLFKDGKGNYFDSNYWLAGRCVSLYESACYFGLQDVDSKNTECRIHGYNVFDTNRRSYWKCLWASSNSFNKFRI